MTSNKYERSVFVLCKCNKVVELPTDESEPLRVTSRPKTLAKGKCDKCGQEIIVYATISMPTYYANAISNKK